MKKLFMHSLRCLGALPALARTGALNSTRAFERHAGQSDFSTVTNTQFYAQSRSNR